MALNLPKLALPKLAVPKLSLDRKQLPAIVGGVVVLAAAGWFGWQYFTEEAAPPPPSKPQAVTPAKPAVKPAAPADTAQNRDKLIEEVLSAAGLKQQLDQLPQNLAAGIRQSGKQGKKPASARVAAVEEALAQAYSAEGFHQQVSADLKKNFDQARLQALLKDFSSPTGKSMIEMERAAHAPEDLAKFAHSSAAKRPASARTELVKRIDAATRASDLAVETAFVSMKAVTAGIVGEDARKAASIDKTIEKQRAAATQKIRDATLLNLAFSFKDASDADLEKYAGIYETENSKWFYGLVYASLLEQVKRASAEAGEAIAKLAVKPASASAPAAPRSAGSRAGADARTCLGLATNTAIIKCAEAYR